MPMPNDRDALKRSFLIVLTEYPLITLLVVAVLGALVFSDVLD
jgi:hypothetical protein